MDPRETTRSISIPLATPPCTNPISTGNAGSASLSRFSREPSDEKVFQLHAAPRKNIAVFLGILPEDTPRRTAGDSEGVGRGRMKEPENGKNDHQADEEESAERCRTTQSEAFYEECPGPGETEPLIHCHVCCLFHHASRKPA